MKGFLVLVVTVLTLKTSWASDKPTDKNVTIITANNSPRTKYGTEKLTGALQKAGYKVVVSTDGKLTATGTTILAGNYGDALVKKAAATWHLQPDTTGKEGFSIKSKPNAIIIAGTDASGTLYGCLELAEQVTNNKAIPAGFSMTDKPEMVLRGTCIGVQKPYYLPGRTVYEYPYTPETFPWLYDKALWVQYLDSLVANRLNSLYLWNGHPFASLVRTNEYPYAVEVDDATFKKNEELFAFLTTEADKRGIWVIQMFYNIIVSKPFAEKHNIKTQDRTRPIVPLIADYTRKSIAAFVAKYPNVGLMVALGEAMEGVGQDDVDWFCKTIIPGVQDGLKILGKKDEPPIVLRAHDTDAPRVMKEALPLYKNLYTEAKFNGEALTTYEPRGPWADLHRSLSRIGTVQIENVHILANLEPFRYGSPDFIQKCVQSMHSVYEANGLHLYPQASYWDWPYTADKSTPRLLEVERDWIWYRTWARYAWKSDRNRGQEIDYWAGSLGTKFGCTAAQAKNIVEAYEQSGEISPKILRRYGITDGNRQTMTLGMLMTQLIDPKRFGLFPLLYNSESPFGEMIIEYALHEANGIPHIGESPMLVADQIIEHGNKAVAAIEQAAPYITANRDEFNRLKNDMYCYQEMAQYYAWKARAAVQVLKFKYSNKVADLEQAVPMLEKSVAYFAELAARTDTTYLYANSMQTQQRKIPVNGKDTKNKTWVELLPFYQRELENFKKHIEVLKKQGAGTAVASLTPLKSVPVTIITENIKTYTVQKNAQVFPDLSVVINELPPLLTGLQGIYYSQQRQITEGTSLSFKTTVPVKLLVAYFAEKNSAYLPEPTLEIDASADDFRQAEVKVANAIAIDEFPAINIHSFTFQAGTHTLTLGKGSCLLLGFINDNDPLPVIDAGLGVSENAGALDWLFEK
ncbi:hypothetical protein A3860_13135 [Niastella vici]|uniref:Beta-hexosaminidase bacterial type N-terminal domain-containing protein n=1 Tax=Niastella vici TaxID=1703345 RepID=A0A1V9G771_9BACT|nr:hypothetical protein [Niastella vici]OQP66430.1 hypothetical protein A3860_13135 [Niastella vici]